jgi:hypothetical protein
LAIADDENSSPAVTRRIVKIFPVYFNRDAASFAIGQQHVQTKTTSESVHPYLGLKACRWAHRRSQAFAQAFLCWTFICSDHRWHALQDVMNGFDGHQ